MKPYRLANPFFRVLLRALIHPMRYTGRIIVGAVSVCAYLLTVSTATYANLLDDSVAQFPVEKMQQGRINKNAKMADVTDIIRIPQQSPSSAGHVGYFVGLMCLALEKTKPKYGPFEIRQPSEVSTQARNMAQLLNGNEVDLLWTMTSREREDALLAVRLPLIKGFMGRRVFLIRPGDQSRFKDISNLQELATLTAGQGSHWPDTQVLRANDLPVQTVTQFELLFSMLKGGRFDYFPRGLHEVNSELLLHPDLLLEQELMLEYPAPMYFFVHPDNKRLADRLLEGLQLAQKDGSFDAYFNAHPVTAGVQEQVNSARRRVIHLRNPLLSPRTGF